VPAFIPNSFALHFALGVEWKCGVENEKCRSLDGDYALGARRRPVPAPATKETENCWFAGDMSSSSFGSVIVISMNDLELCVPFESESEFDKKEDIDEWTSTGSKLEINKSAG